MFVKSSGRVWWFRPKEILVDILLFDCACEQPPVLTWRMLNYLIVLKSHPTLRQNVATTNFPKVKLRGKGTLRILWGS